MGDEEDNDIKRISSPEAISSYQPVSEADRELAGTALQEFEDGNYEQCLITLKRLLNKRSQDLKVLHNTCVVEYYLSNFKDTEIFKQKNLDICKQAHIKIEGVEALDDVDNSVLLYNQAVILFHLHQYHAAVQVIEKVSQYIEPLDENLGKNISFLLCDIYLYIHQPKRLVNFVLNMEGSYFSNNKSCSNKTNQKEKEEQKDENGENCGNEQSKRRFQLTKARLYATLKTSKACKREIKTLMTSGSALQNIPVFFLKSQLEYQRGNYKKAIKLLNSLNISNSFDYIKYFQETGDCLPVIYYNNLGCIHFYMGKPNLGRFYVNKAKDEFEKHILAVTNREHDPTNVLNSGPLHLLSLSTRHQLLFNLGLQAMQLQNFNDAFNCFKEVLRSYYGNPRLWLRIAECCIQIHKPNNVQQLVEYKARPVIETTIGKGRHTKLILNSSDKFSDDLKYMDVDETTPNLPFAMMCLRNARLLMPEIKLMPHYVLSSGKSSSLEDNGTYVSDENFHLSVLPSTYIVGSEIASLRNSILVASSYVSLCLGDVILAEEYAKSLLSQPCISGAHKYLANLYAGEASLLNDKITNAVEHFFIQPDSDIELAFPGSSSEVSLKHQMRLDFKLTEKNDDGSRPVGNIPNWFPNTISSAKFVSRYNLAVAYAVREEWTKALECLEQINSNGDIPTQAYSLLIYIQLHQGRADEIQTYAKPSLIARYS